MTSSPKDTPIRRKKSLRLRMIVSLLSLALLPLIITMLLLYLEVNDYVTELERLQPMSHVREQFISAGTQTAFVLVLFGGIVTFLAWRMADQFLLPILIIRRGAEIVSRINLGHRIQLDTGDELEDLAIEFNHMAENLGTAYDELEGRVQEATFTVQEERNRLATVLRTMVDGVIVANEAAETILMNPRARTILELGYRSGIGSPLSRIFPSDRLNFHLKRVRQRWEQGRETVEEVLFPFQDEKIIKGSLSIVPGPKGERAGYLLVFQNLNSRKSEESLQEMQQLLRGPLATSRSLIDALQRHPDMSPEKRTTFLAAVTEEMDRLSTRVTAIDDAAKAVQSSRWPAIVSDPRELLTESLLLAPGIPVEIAESSTAIPSVPVEPFSWMASLRCVLQWISKMTSGRASVSANLQVEEGFVVTTFRVALPFTGDPTELETLEVAPAGEQALSLGETVHKNRGEIWTRITDTHMEIRLALLLAGDVSEGNRTDGLLTAEPEFYDFDLFLPRPVIERADQLQANLNDLEYVVFDTETTGLRLSEGDKVISISGIRIRRGRIQNAEIFHSLVNPGRSIPPESIIFHHIEDHMVADAPSMNQVYPQFTEFVGDSILVAHNAAFDKKCLEIAAADAGLPMIDNPFLDTLFLSYGLHEGTEGHSLDAMAERMGIIIDGRHTSMGDARATAQAFLGLITLLPGRGVRTLAEAKAFCDRQLLLRWQSSRF
ncbi:MAG: exonuclease domain-containing protein [Desulfuromonadaceae bacterium]|nr:exonuclease domain-containing protein [Desulfuromonadaceae bacterium]